ncbi:hypothetical protein V8C37DRAFT_387308 [Trichoderma ceciliae]
MFARHIFCIDNDWGVYQGYSDDPFTVWAFRILSDLPDAPGQIVAISMNSLPGTWRCSGQRYTALLPMRIGSKREDNGTAELCPRALYSHLMEQLQPSLAKMAS